MGKILSHPLTVVFVTLCAVIFSLSMIRNHRSGSDYQTQLQQLTAKNAELQTKKEILELKKEITAKPIVQEKIIRDGWSRQKPGETIWDLENFKAVAVAEPPPPPPPPSPWSQWLDLLF